MRRTGVFGLVALFVLPPMVTGQVRLKDVATLNGYQPVPLIGYGLVIGLNKTGDRRQTIFSAQTLANMLERFGIAVSPGEIKIENVAAVLVTAQLGPYTATGARIDVTVSSIGDALPHLRDGADVVAGSRHREGAAVLRRQGLLRRSLGRGFLFLARRIADPARSPQLFCSTSSCLGGRDTRCLRGSVKRRSSGAWCCRGSQRSWRRWGWRTR